ncbi:MAG: hypothetical protein H0U58_02610 [Chloroflexi bacterium]|nr:hypothetical protein [Chloroflexota bacterium]
MLVAIVLGLAVVKPWRSASEGQGAGGGGQPTSGLGAAAPIVDPAVPGASRGIDAARELVAAFCLEPSGWRLYATERWSDREVRSWTSIRPIESADGPGDPRIPRFSAASQAVLTLGYCAPIDGVDRPPGATSITIYRRRENAPVTPAADRSWEEIEPERVRPTAGSSPLGGAWAPPAIDPDPARPSVAGSWASGTYVFRIQGVGRESAGFSRWFGVSVEVAPLAP